MARLDFRPPVTLEGVHLRLVPLRAEHAGPLARAGADPEIWTYFRSGAYTTPERMAALVERLLRWQSQGTDLAFTVELKPDLQPVGMTRYLSIRREDQVVEVGGSWLSRPLWRTPLNTEAKYLLLRHAFETEGCHRVEFKTDLRNERSQRAIERLGAVREGTLREHIVLPDGFHRSSVYYGIVSDEWPSVRSRLESLLARPWIRGTGPAGGANPGPPTGPISPSERPR